jgi:hypothetical protein
VHIYAVCVDIGVWTMRRVTRGSALQRRNNCTKFRRKLQTRIADGAEIWEAQHNGAKEELVVSLFTTHHPLPRLVEHTEHA